MNDKLKKQFQHRIKVCMWVIIAGLALSGITAFPIETELSIFSEYLSTQNGPISLWLNRVYDGVRLTNHYYPYISYGTDWLAFAHLMLAILFIGPLKDPVKNIWVIQFGIIAAILIFPLAFIAGGIRGIPFLWQLGDCSFGVVTLLILIPCYRMVLKLSNNP